MNGLDFRPKNLNTLSNNISRDLYTAASDETGVNILAGLESTMQKERGAQFEEEWEKREFGELSSWVPSGKVLGMKVPMGTGEFLDNLFLGVAGIGSTGSFFSPKKSFRPKQSLLKEKGWDDYPIAKPSPNLSPYTQAQKDELIEAGHKGAEWTRDWNRHPLVRQRRGLENIDKRIEDALTIEEMYMRNVELGLPLSQQKAFREYQQRRKSSRYKEIKNEIDTEEGQLVRLESPINVKTYHKLSGQGGREGGFAVLPLGEIHLNEAASISRGKVNVEQAKSLGVHEADHMSFVTSEYDSEIILNSMYSHNQTYLMEYFQSLDSAGEIDMKIFKRKIEKKWGDKASKMALNDMSQGGKNPIYLLENHEVHARVMQLRHQMGWKTFDDIPEHILKDAGTDKVRLPKSVLESDTYQQLSLVFPKRKISELMVRLSGFAAPVAVEDMLLEHMKEPEAGILSEL